MAQQNQPSSSTRNANTNDFFNEIGSILPFEGGLSFRGIGRTYLTLVHVRKAPPIRRGLML